MYEHLEALHVTPHGLATKVPMLGYNSPYVLQCTGFDLSCVGIGDGARLWVGALALVFE